MAKKTLIDDVLDLVKSACFYLPFWAVPILAALVAGIAYWMAVKFFALMPALTETSFATFPLWISGFAFVLSFGAGLSGWMERKRRRQLVMNAIKSLRRAMNSDHLKRWEDFAAYIAFEGQSNQEELELAIEESRKMLNYLSSPSAHLTDKDLSRMKQLVFDSNLSSSTQEQILLSWDRFDFTTVDSELNRLEVSAVTAMLHLLEHLKQSEWAYTSDSYNFKSPSDQRRFDLLMKDLMQSFDQLQALRTELERKIENTRIEFENNSN